MVLWSRSWNTWKPGAIRKSGDLVTLCKNDDLGCHRPTPLLNLGAEWIATSRRSITVLFTVGWWLWGKANYCYMTVYNKLSGATTRMRTDSVHQESICLILSSAIRNVVIENQKYINKEVNGEFFSMITIQIFYL